MTRTRIGIALGALLLLGACGTEEGRTIDAEQAPPVDRPRAVPAAPGEVTTRYPVTVIDEGGGAELCLGGVAHSLPPQCDGPALVAWDWSDHPGDFDQRAGVRWGDFVVTGTFDGEALTPTRVLPASDVAPPSYEETDLTSRCPEPDGGWRVQDPATTTQASLDRTMRTAERLDDFSNAWVDQSINPAYRSSDPAEMERNLNDPEQLVINVQVVDDVGRAERALREVWGGSLCVSRARFTDDQMAAAQAEASELPGFAGSGRLFDQVDLTVTYDDGSLQAWVDQEYGEGLVQVESALVGSP